MDLTNDYTYRLVGVVSHLGETTQSGHYVSDVFSDDQGRWYHYDDKQVSCIDEASSMQKRHQRNGYIFFYLQSNLRS